ncbi:hypothetical protein O6H91_08G005900 [Diphasiastrum complanatum]|uniref:Uncharacterized protein n=1 Tax=Diphasiastrum complanatum TaxID=34168 RepID=A0ACC2CUP2_DIPCM|nr:hypothetical protein O6H91_08G005900 [Diphasiastrum complanatum]
MDRKGGGKRRTGEDALQKGAHHDAWGAEGTFLLQTPEKRELNQYWYSPHTIATLVKEIEEHAKKAAFLSTPSVFFSLKDPGLKSGSCIFDVDTQWESLPNFVKWNFNQPQHIDESYHHVFDYIVIDPPFVTPEVWIKYAEAARLLLRDDGKIILSTILENAELLKQILHVEPQLFDPSIPHLVYQYAFFTNYKPTYLSSPNPEISMD